MALLVDTEAPWQQFEAPEACLKRQLSGAEQREKHQFWNTTNLVLEGGLDWDLHAVRDTFTIFPHVVNQQVA